MSEFKTTARTAQALIRSGIGATLDETPADREAHNRRKAEQAARLARIAARAAEAKVAAAE